MVVGARRGVVGIDARTAVTTVITGHIDNEVVAGVGEGGCELELVPAAGDRSGGIVDQRGVGDLCVPHKCAGGRQFGGSRVLEVDLCRDVSAGCVSPGQFGDGTGVDAVGGGEEVGIALVAIVSADGAIGGRCSVADGQACARQAGGAHVV